MPSIWTIAIAVLSTFGLVLVALSGIRWIHYRTKQRKRRQIEAEVQARLDELFIG